MQRYAILSLVLTAGLMTPAKAEVTDCQEITLLPKVITAAGVWCLKQNLSWNGTAGKAIDVQRAAVTIDLNGFAITGVGSANTQAVGVYSQNRRNVTIRNGTIRGFHTGVQLSTGSVNHVIENLHIDQSRLAGVMMVGSGNILRNNQITNTGGTPGEFDNNFGVIVSQASTTSVIDNIISGTGANFGAYGIQVANSNLTEIRGNSILNTVGGNTGYAILSDSSTQTTIQNNRVLNGAALGNFSIVGNLPAGTNCIGNVIARFSNPKSGCSFSSGNFEP